MGYKEIDIRVSTSCTEDEIRNVVAKKIRISEFSYQVVNKSLDARKKPHVVWQMRIGVHSSAIQGESGPEKVSITIPYKKRNQKIVVVGNGPAGFFAAYILQKAGFNTQIIERGSNADDRAKGIREFEKSGQFNPTQNYAFGEGGAGTFSDGKLTSRSKHISKERQFILSSYINAGAPKEIAYMAHPHVGSDNLRKVVKNLRAEYIADGGQVHFETLMEDLVVKNRKITEVVTDKGGFECDHCILGIGHSAYETYKMLIKKGIPFRTKNFAIGSRAEHVQSDINYAQWGVAKLPGVKAAEYRLTSNSNNRLPVYTFCMCPGGVVVPATAYEKSNIVNGMSYYKRNGQFANAACVAGVHPDQLIEKDASPEDALLCLEALEQEFYEITNSYKAPFCTINDFVKGKLTTQNTKTSFPLGIQPWPLWEMLPKQVVSAMREGLIDFNNKLRGYGNGILLGLESKTSSPIQVLRNEDGSCSDFSNLFMIGEGSGYTGGIVSSAADGVKTAMNLLSAAV